MGETTAQVGGYIKVVSGTRITGMYRYFFLVLVFVVEVWKIAKLYLDVLEKFCFDKEKFFL